MDRPLHYTLASKPNPAWVRFVQCSRVCQSHTKCLDRIICPRFVSSQQLSSLASPTVSGGGAQSSTRISALSSPQETSPSLEGTKKFFSTFKSILNVDGGEDKRPRKNCVLQFGSCQQKLW
eukprot:GFUD01044427.1.p2 GENE.GFUD01044427.1~~GFUD01044427.1.p2  ORF type:complete len:121 (+),score=22.28 GFUD01044427.1:242-604(+)